MVAQSCFCFKPGNPSSLLAWQLGPTTSDSHPALHSSACMHTGCPAISAVPSDCQLIFGRRESWQHCSGRWQSTLPTGKGLADKSANCTAVLCLQHDRSQIASVCHDCTLPTGRHLPLVLRLKKCQIAAYRQRMLHTLCGESLRNRAHIKLLSCHCRPLPSGGAGQCSGRCCTPSLSQQRRGSLFRQAPAP